MKATLLLLAIAGQTQIMEDANVNAYRRLFPAVDDPFVSEVLSSPDSMLYSDRELPPMYQDNGQAIRTSTNTSGGRDPVGNANGDFPWQEGMGGDLDRRVQTVKLLKLPRDTSGQLLPVAHWKDGNLTRWIYPHGTVLGEIGFMVVDRKWYPFEGRFRIREESDWGVEVIRPFPQLGDLVDRLNELGRSDLADAIANAPRETVTLEAFHPRPSIQAQKADLLKLPAMPPELVANLLRETTWKSATGVKFAEHTDGMTSTADLGIVPRDYQGHISGTVERESCRQCHADVLKPARTFDRERPWRGRVRGSDGIFSFHPFGESRAKLTAAGMLAPFDKATHTEANYRQSTFLVEELKR